MAELYANRYKAFLQNDLVADYEDRIVVVSIAPPLKLQRPGSWRIKIGNEIMLVNDVDPDGVTLTVDRGVEDTVLEEHPEGSLVTHILTAAALTTIIAEGITGGNLWAQYVQYDNNTSDLNAENVQDALDEIITDTIPTILEDYVPYDTWVREKFYTNDIFISPAAPDTTSILDTVNYPYLINQQYIPFTNQPDTPRTLQIDYTGSSTVYVISGIDASGEYTYESAWLNGNGVQESLNAYQTVFGIFFVSGFPSPGITISVGQGNYFGTDRKRYSAGSAFLDYTTLNISTVYSPPGYLIYGPNTATWYNISMGLLELDSNFGGPDGNRSWVVKWDADILKKIIKDA